LSEKYQKMVTTIKAFQELKLQELYGILRLRAEVFVVEQACIYNDLDGLDINAVHIWISDSKSVIATARILPAGTRFPQVSIGRVVVHPHHRGKELGKLIMRKSMEYAQKSLKAEEIKISAQLYLKEFYESLGFKMATSIYDEDGIPHIGMVWYSQNKTNAEMEQNS
jgi:ElaA protein